MTGAQELTRTPRGWRKTILGVTTGVLSAAFAFSGMAKIMMMSPMPENYWRWGYPTEMLYIVGGFEVLCALLLLVPIVASFAAGLLGLLMAGAVATHLMAGEAPMALVPAGFILVLTIVGWARRCEAFAFMRLSVPWLKPPTCTEP